MARQCVFGWVLTKQRRRNGAFLIDVAKDRGENHYRARCSCSCHISIGVREDPDREDSAFLRDSLMYDDELELTSLTLPPLCPVFLFGYQTFHYDGVHGCCASNMPTFLIF